LIESDDEECLIKETKLKKAKDDSMEKENGALNVDDISKNNQTKTIHEDQISENTSIQTPEKNNFNSIRQKNNFCLKFWGLNEKDIDIEKTTSFQSDESQVGNEFKLQAKYVRLGNLIGQENSTLDFETNEGVKITMSGNLIFSSFKIFISALNCIIRIYCLDLCNLVLNF